MNNTKISQIVRLAFPMVLAMLSQNLLTLVDTAMVGTQGSYALAAVGIAGFALFMGHSLLLGLANGVQAVVARRVGEKDHSGAAEALRSAIFICLTVGPLFSVLIYLLTPIVFPWLNSDKTVVSVGIPYMQYIALASIFLGINFSFRGYWMGVNKPKVFFWVLLVMHAINILLNYMLIFGKLGAPTLGAPGAGLATLLSMAMGAILNVVFAGIMDFDKFFGLNINRDSLRAVVKLSLPNGFQQLFVAAGFVVLLWIVGRVGTNELAAASVLINIMLVAILPGMAFGLTAATLVGQSMGQKNFEGAFYWAIDVSRVALVFLGVIGIPMWLLPEQVLSVFIHDPITLDLAVLPMRVVGVTIILEAINLVFMNALLGAGDAQRVMRVTFSGQWLLFLPLAYVVGPVLGFGLLGIWILQLLFRACQSFVFAVLWHKKGWTRITV